MGARLGSSHPAPLCWREKRFASENRIGGALPCLSLERDKTEAAMHRIWLLAAALLGLVTAAGAAEDHRSQPGSPAPVPESGSSSSELSRSGGVITPPAEVDPRMKQTPPPSGDKMPVVPPPGTPGGNPSVKPK